MPDQVGSNRLTAFKERRQRPRIYLMRCGSYPAVLDGMLLSSCCASGAAVGPPLALPGIEAFMVLIQLLLPVGCAIDGEGMAPLAETRRELAHRFNGLTAYARSPAKGWWTSPDGRTEQDDVVMVEVVTETFDRAWWRGYARTLAVRFDQESIHVRAVPVDMLDEEHQ